MQYCIRIHYTGDHFSFGCTAVLVEDVEVERLDLNLDDGCVDVPESDVHDVQAAGRPDDLFRQASPQATFAAQTLFKRPSDYIRHLIATLPSAQRLTRDQTLFMVRFAACCDEVWDDEHRPPAERRVHHLLLLGAGGSGKTFVVQTLVFKAVQFIWPATSNSEPTLTVVAASNAQAKNISTADVKARAIHNASGMRIQKLTNDQMRPGTKLNSLSRLWNQVRVLIIEEVSMVAAAWYNMLDVRSMHGRSKLHDVTEATYKRPFHHFGRVPIVIHLGDFLQLSPTANISLVENVNAKRDDGSYRYAEPPSLEVQHAIRVFAGIPHVFELLTTKRFKEGDPLIDFLQCMRAGRRFPNKVWKAFEATFAKDNHQTLDQRHMEERFRKGFGLALYWETLSRWMTRRSQRDAAEAGVPVVFLQAVDECNTIDREKAMRLLNVPNLHNTGHIHGVFPAHIGMRVRFTVKVNSRLGLVQEQRATIVAFAFKDEDSQRYRTYQGGDLFRPKFLPAGVWLLVDDFKESPIADDLEGFVSDALVRPGLHLYTPIEATFTWRSSESHTVRRTGFALTHEKFLTSTASQGQTIRTGATIDCARAQSGGRTGMPDDDWWLHLYVLFSRCTCMDSMLLLRPPPRDLLERGPPPHVQEALQRFNVKIGTSRKAAEELAALLMIPLP